MTDAPPIDRLKAIAHPVRLAILAALAGAERNVGEIEQSAGIGQPALSQQLAVLRQAGLVATRREGKLIYYAIARERLDEVARFLGALAGARGGSVEAPAARSAAPGAANFAKMS